MKDTTLVDQFNKGNCEQEMEKGGTTTVNKNGIKPPNNCADKRQSSQSEDSPAEFEGISQENSPVLGRSRSLLGNLTIDNLNNGFLDSPENCNNLDVLVPKIQSVNDCNAVQLVSAPSSPIGKISPMKTRARAAKSERS